MRPADERRSAAHPVAVAGEVVREAAARGGLLLLMDHEAIRCGTRPSRPGPRLSLLARGALVALAAKPATRVVVVSADDASDLEIEINVPGVFYAGCGGLEIRGAGLAADHPTAAEFRAWRTDASPDPFPAAASALGFSARWVLEQWTDDRCGEPLPVYIGEGENAGLDDGWRSYTVRVGPPSRQWTEQYRVDDRAAATDLLAQIAWTWNPEP
jgi:hypothetical protein